MKRKDILANIVLLFSILVVANGISKDIKSQHKEPEVSTEIVSVLDDANMEIPYLDDNLEDGEKITESKISYIDNNEDDVIAIESEIPLKDKLDSVTIDAMQKIPTKSNKNAKEKKIIYVAYLNDDTLVYDGEDNVIGSIEMYQKVFIINKLNRENIYIQYTNSSNEIVNGYIPRINAELLPNTYIEIDIDAQELNMYTDGELVISSPIVSGMSYESPTGIGYFEIYYKEENAILRSYYDDGTLRYESYVDYWMSFDGGIGLHDAEFHTHEDGFSHGWRSSDSFGGDTYLYNGSHGCVNLPYSVAEFIYNNSDIGTKVLVHK